MWEEEEPVIRCELCGAVIDTDWYADVEYKGKTYHAVCDGCYDEIYEEWLGEHRRVY